jgi:hypothetical protein
MEEIVELFEELRGSWEYNFYGYIKKLSPLDKDDIANGVLLKLFTAYEEDRIDMKNLKNYMFITYRNHIYGLFNKKKTISIDNVEIYQQASPDVDYIEVYEYNPIIKKIEKLIGVKQCQEIIAFYANKLSTDKDDINPRTGETFNGTDSRRYETWRRKLRFFLNNKEKN